MYNFRAYKNPSTYRLRVLAWRYRGLQRTVVKKKYFSPYENVGESHVIGQKVN